MYESGFFKMVPSTSQPGTLRRSPIMMNEPLDGYLTYAKMTQGMIEYKNGTKLMDVYNSAADILDMTGRFKADNKASLAFFGCHMYYFLRADVPAISTTFIFAFDFDDPRIKGQYCTVVFVKVPSKSKLRISAVTDYPMSFYADSKSDSGLLRLRNVLRQDGVWWYMCRKYTENRAQKAELRASSEKRNSQCNSDRENRISRL